MIPTLPLNYVNAFKFRPQTGKVANVILDGAEEDDDADEFLVEEKPKDALELEMEPRPSSSTNLTNVSFQNLKGFEASSNDILYIFCILYYCKIMSYILG